MDVTREEMEAAADYIRWVERAMASAPELPTGTIFECGCVGPLPECRCQRRNRLVQSFLAKINDTDAA